MVTAEDDAHAARIAQAARGAAMCRQVLAGRKRQADPTPARALTASELIHRRALERARGESRTAG